MKYVKVINQNNPAASPILAKYCQSFFCQLRGLMFARSLPENNGLLLVQNSDNRVDTAITMSFMWMDLAVIWINSSFIVVDKVLARRWKLMYIPKRPAKYMLEAAVSHLGDFNIGDMVSLVETSDL